MAITANSLSNSRLISPLCYFTRLKMSCRERQWMLLEQLGT